MPVDLSSPIKVNVVSVSEKPNGGAKISIEVSEMSQYPFTVHLNPDQSAMLEGVGEYTALLVPSKLKDGKDGSWQSDYWYNVFSFNGVIDERNQPTSNVTTEVKKPEPVQEKVVGVGSSRPVSATGLIKEEELSLKDRLIVQEIALKLSFELTKGKTPEEHAYNASLLYPKILEVFYGRFKTSPLVEEASKQGAKVVDIKPTEEPLFEEESDEEWDYRKPSNLKTNADFLMYTQKCGWIQEDVQKWLDNSVPDNWVKNNNKTWLQAAKVCKEKALEQGLEPPYDFRQPKK